jgi:hypothetical protein
LRVDGGCAILPSAFSCKYTKLDPGISAKGQSLWTDWKLVAMSAFSVLAFTQWARHRA